MAFDMSEALAIRRCDPELRNFVKSGGRTGSGREQKVRADAGFWVVSFEFVATNKERVNAYRALIARLRQGEQVVARICDRYHPRELGSSRLGASAPARATSVQIIGFLDDLDPGQHFTIGQRLHRVTEVTAQSSTDAGTVTGTYTGNFWDDASVWSDDPQITSTVKFVPPLRAAAASGAVVEFDDLKLLCEIDDPKDGDLSLALLKRGTPTLTLVESI